jgi:acetyl-CoA/propionyl-CoA carboxylase biotin carboxyl carrier protein
VPLAGLTPAQTYLDPVKVLRAAAVSGADALHPGYGFLAENAEFAQAVVDAGLTWIGPPPAVIERLGDKLSARQLARRAGAHLLPGTTAAVSDAAGVLSFAREAGLPIVIKVPRGGGGAGVAVARSLGDIPGSYARAVQAAGGRPDCFAERYLDRARHLETQCLADAYGRVAVISTRGCSLQRRHQKIVEEAPAPFLPDGADARLRAVSRSILRAAGYLGAATCEFLLGPEGSLAFLEVNPRLAVAHPVTEEVAGIDLVRETFRLATGEPLGYGDRPARGHAVQFRIYAEDPGRGFGPAQGDRPRLASPVGSWRAARSGRRPGLGDQAGVRHAAGQADRDRRLARRGGAAGSSRAIRVRG